jgi:hypothetical protein
VCYFLNGTITYVQFFFISSRNVHKVNCPSGSFVKSNYYVVVDITHLYQHKIEKFVSLTNLNLAHLRSFL